MGHCSMRKLLVVALVLTGCSAAVTAVDTHDGGEEAVSMPDPVLDSGSPRRAALAPVAADASRLEIMDAGTTTDAAALDAGGDAPTDSGGAIDSGSTIDTGVPGVSVSADTGAPDSSPGPVDSGAPADAAGGPVDTGAPDTFVPPPVVDAGQPDTFVAPIVDAGAPDTYVAPTVTGMTCILTYPVNPTTGMDCRNAVQPPAEIETNVPLLEMSAGGSVALHITSSNADWLLSGAEFFPDTPMTTFRGNGGTITRSGTVFTVVVSRSRGSSGCFYYHLECSGTVADSWPPTILPIPTGGWPR